MSEHRNPCIAYSDPRLAQTYDHINPWGPDLDFHLSVAGEGRLAVLDLGCGTGRLAVELARRGHRVTGADPSPGMLDVARRRAGGELVRLIDATAAGLRLKDRFDLAIMTGHAFQAIIHDDDIAASLANVRRHLAPGGRFSFETRNPLVREWVDWTPEKSREQVAVPGVGTVEVSYDILAAEGELVTFETRFAFPGGDRFAVPHTLRFLGQTSLAAMLAGAGFSSVDWYGDFDRSPLAATSPEIIAIAA